MDKKALDIKALLQTLKSKGGNALQELGASTARGASRLGFEGPMNYVVANPTRARLMGVGGAALGAGALGLGGAAYGAKKLLGGGGEEKEAAGPMPVPGMAQDLKAILMAGGIMGGTGAIAGAGAGALNPPEGESRLHSAGMGALGGAALGSIGGIGGAAVGHQIDKRIMQKGLLPRSSYTGAGALGGAVGGGMSAAKYRQYVGKKKSEPKKEEPKEEKSEPKKEEKKEANAGTPFTDGFLVRCMQYGFDGDTVASMLEKGAEQDGRMGQECRDFLDRLVKS